MNVFEDLIEELREENLLEETIIDLRKPRQPTDTPGGDLVVEREGDGSADVAPERAPVSAANEKEPMDESDFYRKRAMDEISSLQMVEHVLCGIEREYMRVMPTPFDDLEAKKALHKFLQVQGDSSTREYAEAEFYLMHQTEAWSTALSERDTKISVANLRRFCENSRPVLSSQALIALGRFYRNTPYSDVSRAKFDLVMTRLFSKETERDMRRLLFNRVDMVGHIKTLYANWASIALYSAEEASLTTRAVVAGFEDRVKEIENAQSFDDLLKSSFFKKVYEFKEATGEMFFTPEVVGAAIDCNIRIGNRFIDLIRLEKERSDHGSVEQKYGYEHDQIISDAAGKTLHLVEVLKNLPEETHDVDTTPQVPEKPTRAVKKAPEKRDRSTSSLFRVNKWLLAATVLIALASGGLFFWSSQPDPESSVAEKAGNLELNNKELDRYLRDGRSTAETLYAITLPTWSELPEEKKKEVLQKAQDFAKDNKLRNVRLINVRGDLEAFATPERAEVLNPSP